MLTILERIPEGLLERPAELLYEVLDGPTLIHLAGTLGPPLFITVLLHGNEHTSWDAARQLLARHQGGQLKRAISLFIGNVEAARYNQRFLDHQVDFNRIWGGAQAQRHPLAAQVVDQMATRNIFASVDVHNNTGKNPHYACVNVVAPAYLHLARMFSRTVVFFTRPDTVQSMAFAPLCPAITVEAGLSGDPRGTEHVYQFLEDCLALPALPDGPIDAADVDLYHTVAIAKVAPRYSLGFGDPTADINFDHEIEYFNFREIAPDTPLGSLRPTVREPFIVTNEAGDVVTGDYLFVDQGQLKNRRPLVPAMITRDINAIRKDCFCYFMERYPVA